MSPVKTPVRGRRAAAAPPTGHCFGSHLSIAGGLHHAIEEARRLGFDTVQVFVKNQRQWRAPPLRREAVDRWLAERAAARLETPVAHATYLINLASADRRLFRQSRDAFAEELIRCDTLEIPYLVVHPGAACGAPEAAAAQRVARALDEIFERHPGLCTMPLLELTAGQGSTLGRSFEQIGEIIRHVQEPHRVGVCIDTCHVFAAGYDIRDAAAYRQMIALADAQFGVARIRCWHLNDSKGALGSRIDRHEHIGRGRIGNRGFANVLADKRFRGVPMILETPKDQDARGREWDTLNLRRLRSIARRML